VQEGGSGDRGNIELIPVDENSIMKRIKNTYSSERRIKK
jgi:hypothetical protein